MQRGVNKWKQHLFQLLCLCTTRANFYQNLLKAFWNKTYQKWELLLIDDGSKDDSIDIALAFMEKIQESFTEK